MSEAPPPTAVDVNSVSALDPTRPGESPVKSGQRKPSIESGVAAITAVWRTLPVAPGVYRMLGWDGGVLYVGKARSLKARVANYTRPDPLPMRLKRMISETVSMEIVVTRSEVEALLLESNLIKSLKPRYNVLLRDDKTFAEILVATDHAFPQILKVRGTHKRPGHYFGPFASTNAVNRSLGALQKAFLLRSCTDHVFANRSRPCLQYHIKRCTAPCVDKVDAAQYAGQVEEARRFLAGESRAVQDEMAARMQSASQALDFEAAAKFRDRLRALTALHSTQDINLGEGLKDADVVALWQEGGQAALQLVFYRGGRMLGSHALLVGHPEGAEPAAMMATLVAQFYARHPPPPLLLLSAEPDEPALLTEFLAGQAGRRVEIAVPQRGDKRRLIEQAIDNARAAHGRALAETASQTRLLSALAEVLGLDAPPERIEIYDNSHIRGAHAIGAMVVAGPEGFEKKHYRTFNIKGEITPGDDYAMMREVLSRRFARARDEDPEREGWPDLVLIDGGKGQLSSAVAVLEELGIADVPLVAVAKGEDRDAGRETLHRPNLPMIALPLDHPVQFFIQRLRDEAHRFAIGTHRAKRGRAIRGSPLDDLPGVGAARKKALLLHFGSAKAVARASIDDLRKVAGISANLAEKIRAALNGGA